MCSLPFLDQVNCLYPSTQFLDLWKALGSENASYLMTIHEFNRDGKILSARYLALRVNNRVQNATTAVRDPWKGCIV